MLWIFKTIGLPPAAARTKSRVRARQAMRCVYHPKLRIGVPSGSLWGHPAGGQSVSCTRHFYDFYRDVYGGAVLIPVVCEVN